jgi:DNA-binding CsgD family transcriptional regulator
MDSVTHTPGPVEPVRCPPDDLLLERNPELAALGQRIAALSAGSSSGSSVLLSGEAGVGKTTVLRAAARQADRRIDWLWGTCEPMLSPTPLGPLVDWLDRMPPALAAAVRAGRHAADVLSGVLSMLRDPTRPTVLVVDDAQWADGATLDLLRYLGRRIESTSALLVLSYRDDSLASDHPLLGVLSGLPARSCTRLALSPLSRAAVAEMARRAGRSARGLYDVTQGNPFFVTELLAGDPQTLPASVRDAILARIAPLPPAARELIELASVSPTQIEVAVLDALVADARASIAVCAAAGLLGPEGGALRFRHELARRAVEASLSPGRAAELHAAVFAALSGRGAALVRLVHHAARAGMSGAVLTLAPQAAREAAQASAHRQAAALYALALEHAADLPLAERAELHVAHSLECQYVQRHDDATLSRRAALALHRQLGDRLGEGRDLYELAVVEQYREGIKAGLPYVHAAIEVLEGIDATVDLAVAYAAKAQMHLQDGTSHSAAEWGRKALDLLDGQAGAEECLAYALNTVASAQLRSQDVPEAWLLLERSRDIALEHGLESHAARAYLQMASLCLLHRRYLDAEVACEQGLAYCETHDLDVYRVPFHARHGYALLETGHWDDADAQIATVHLAASLSQLDASHATALQQLIDLRRGRDRSHPYWNEMLDGKRAIGVGHWFSPLPVACCEAAWLRGDDAQVRRIATEALELAMASAEGWRIGHLACWLRRAGGARPQIAQALPAPCALELEGDVRAAALAWAAIGCSYQQALALLGGDVADLRQALALLNELGAAPAARIARRRLRALGVRDVQRGPRSRTRVDPLGLTAREREVLELLAQRLSNRAIADRLHRSERTVENHVAALLGKLGVANRNEAVERAGLHLQN